MSSQQRAHRRHAHHLNRGLFDPPHTTSSDDGDDFLSFLFPPDPSESTTSTTSSTSPLFPPLITTGVSDPFSTTVDPLTTTTSTTQSTSTSSSASSTSTSTTSSIAQTTQAPPPSSTTVILQVTSSATNATASSTNSVAPSGASTNAGKIIGGVGAGVLALAAVLALISFFLRRRRHKDEDPNVFDAPSFRRSAALIPDTPIVVGYNPRNPPPMMEHRPPTFGTMYGAPGPNHNGFSPVSPYGPPQYGYAPDSHANPFMPLAPPVQSPFSPVDTATNPFNDTPILTRMPSAATSPLSRQSSGRTNSTTVHTAEYIDLDRSSATPAYQVASAQYVEISRKQSLSTAAQDEALAEEAAPPVPQKDTSASRASQSDENVFDLEFPVPPSPVLTLASSKHGISTTPPILPEIFIRDSGYDFPSPAIGSQFPSGVTDVAGAQTLTMKAESSSSFPVTPSPMASSFQLTPGPEEKDFTPSASLSVPAAAHKRPETVYDIDDAYGGF